MRWSIILLMAMFVIGGCSDDGSSNGEAEAQGDPGYLATLEAEGFGDFFVSEEAALDYLENYCRGAAESAAVPEDDLDAVVARFCDSDLAEMLGFAATVPQAERDDLPSATTPPECLDLGFEVESSLDEALTVQGFTRAHRAVEESGIYYVSVEVVAASSSSARGEFVLLVTDDVDELDRFASVDAAAAEAFDLPGVTDLGYEVDENGETAKRAVACSQAVRVA